MVWARRSLPLTANSISSLNFYFSPRRTARTRSRRLSSSSTGSRLDPLTVAVVVVVVLPHSPIFRGGGEGLRVFRPSSRVRAGEMRERSSRSRSERVRESRASGSDRPRPRSESSSRRRPRSALRSRDRDPRSSLSSSEISCRPPRPRLLRPSSSSSGRSGRIAPPATAAVFKARRCC